MEAILELDDDIFYKDLSNQISLLIMDDDDDDRARYPLVNLEGYTPSRQLFPPLNNYEHRETSTQIESKGTGVFIPRSFVSNHRKKNSKKGRKPTAYSSNKSKRACCICSHHNWIPKKSYADNINK